MSETSKLFGHKTLFSNLIYLDQIEKFPNKILLNGPKGIGKKIFVNHLLNNPRNRVHGLLAETVLVMD